MLHEDVMFMCEVTWGEGNMTFHIMHNLERFFVTACPYRYVQKQHGKLHDKSLNTGYLQVMALWIIFLIIKLVPIIIKNHFDEFLHVKI